MICPHCNTSLTYRERSGKTCGTCHKSFVFEPKGHPLGLHDLRFWKTLQKVSDNGRLYVTADQLRYALSRKPVAAQTRFPLGCGVIASLAAGVFVGWLTLILL